MFRAVVGRIGAVVLGIASVGCDPGEPSRAVDEQPFRGTKVVLAAVGDASVLPGLSAQRGEWTATRGAELAILPAAVEPGSTRGAAVLVFPGDRLGDLIDAGALARWPDDAVRLPSASTTADKSTPDGTPEAEPAEDELQFADILPAFRDRVTKWGADRYALPLGGSGLVLAWNRSAFDREPNREAARLAGLALEPPATWEQFDALARFFHGRDWDGDGRPDSGVALAWGADASGVGDAILLARAASLGQHPDQYSFAFDSDTMEPRIATPPFVEALTALTSLAAQGPPGAASFDADAARAAFRDGKSAILIDLAERAGTWGGQQSIGIAPPPGSNRVYDPARRTWETLEKPNRPVVLTTGGGWLVGVAASTSGQARSAAVDLARHLASPVAANRIRLNEARPMLPARASQLAGGPPATRSAVGVDARRWSEAVTATLTAARVEPGLRIPGAVGYRADLAEARVKAVGGEPAEAALNRAASAWTARTKALGLDRQLWHYRRSLNVLATLPDPPAR